MTLLPIIYTSLLIFFSLLAFVSLISYISYKTRSKENPLITEEKRKIQKINVIKHNIPQPVYSYQLTRTSNSLKNEVVKTELKQKPLVVHENYFELRNPYHQNSSPYFQSSNNNIRKEYPPQIDNRKILSESNRNKLTRTRLEIMNNTLQFQNNNLQNYEYPTRNKTTHDITQTNILNFYQDKEDHRLVAITAVPFIR